MVQIHIKKFKDLSLDELYALLQLRSEVFCVEQDCVYQDLDGKDKRAYHAIGKKNNEIVAYTRIFGPGDYFDEASIGRVLVRNSERKYGFGQEIMEASIKAIDAIFNTKLIRISAQSYLIKFYSSLGFEKIGEVYLEDGIPHNNMIKRK